MSAITEAETWGLPAFLIWCSIPWAIGIFKLLRRFRYERQQGYETHLLNPFATADRIRHYRKHDDKYDEMHRDLRRWNVVIVVWWFGSFFAIAISTLLFDT